MFFMLHIVFCSQSDFQKNDVPWSEALSRKQASVRRRRSSEEDFSMRIMEKILFETSHCSCAEKLTMHILSNNKLKIKELKQTEIK